MYNSSRAVRPVNKDHYESNGAVAALAAAVARDQQPPGALIVDPCAGFGSIYAELPEPKRAFDIVPQFEECLQQDFLEADRPTEGPLLLCMNPPFSLRGQRSGVVAFLNKAAELLRAGEVCVAVVPHSMRRWINIRRVAPALHLEEEHVMPKETPFRTPDGRRCLVCVAVQVWRLRETPRLEPEYARSHPDFTITCGLQAERPVFFFKNWGSGTRIGALADEDSLDASGTRSAVGTIKARKGTAYCVYGGPEVRARFQALHAGGDWERYTRYTSAGRNNPNVNVAEICSVYAHGVDYYEKKNWGVQVRIYE